MKVFDELKSKLSELELEEDKVNELVEFAKKEVPKDFIPKDKYNEKVSALEVAQEKIEQYEEKAAKVDELLKEKDELKEKVDEIEQTYKKKLDETEKSYKTRIEKTNKKNILKDDLIKNGADPEFVDLIVLEMETKGKIDEMKLNDDGSDIIGKNDYINEIKEKRNKAFKKITNNTEEPKGGEPSPSDENELSSKELIEKRLKERGAKF